jgi:chromosome segregation ATPase
MVDRDRVVVTDPDPTEAVKEALTLAIKNLDEKLSQRLDQNDKAVELAREEVKTAARDLAKANADALDAALKTTTNSASKLAESFETANKATNEKIDRLTERINIWTGRDNTAADSKTDRTTDKGQALVMISILIALAAFVYGFVKH